MRSAPLRAYVAFVLAAGAFVLITADWSAFTAIGSAGLVGLATLALIGLASELFALTVKVAGSPGKSSITFIPVLACILLFGGPPTVLLLVVTGAISEFLVRKKPAVRAAFNVAQWAVAATLASEVYALAGGIGIAIPGPAPTSLISQIGPFAVFGVVFLFTNHAAVSLAIALSQELPFREVWTKVVGRSGTNLFYDLLVSPVGLAVAVAYRELGVLGFVIALLPLVFIRHSYMINIRLVEANRDLLKALVKAIETRDPYTSGHSLRVSALARRIAQRMGLSDRRVRYIEAAALLHDIGKIDASYTEILKKPSALSAEERRVIESHVHKGVELLRSLASFPREVIEAVKSHHERPDGKGYPDGLAGDAIPLGARIIKVCDAVDAMLSDRPYRPALELDDVRDELLRYTASQFDTLVTEVVVSSGLLEEHARELKLIREASAGVRQPSWLEEEPTLDALFL